MGFKTGYLLCLPENKTNAWCPQPEQPVASRFAGLTSTPNITLSRWWPKLSTN